MVRRYQFAVIQIVGICSNALLADQLESIAPAPSLHDEPENLPADADGSVDYRRHGLTGVLACVPKRRIRTDERA